MSGEISTKKIIIWMGAFLLATSVLVVVFKSTDTSSNTSAVKDSLVRNLPPVTESDWVYGTTTPKLTLIEYSDFQCPACLVFFPIVERITVEYADKLQFVYRHFPLPQHEQAKPAAYAAEAAGKQGKFFEMYREIFVRQRDWVDNKDADKIFSTYASSLGLDMSAYIKDFKSSDVQFEVENDYRDGISAGVDATPTFFLNGKKLNNPRSYNDFKLILDAELNNNP